MPIPIVLLHGHVGAGKTALLREFLWWRRKTGDLRPSLWIDFDSAQGARDVLERLARLLPEPLAPDLGLERLQERAAHALNTVACWVVWDHLHSIRDGFPRAPDAPFSSADRKLLASFLLRLDGSHSAIFAASRGEEAWLGCPPPLRPVFRRRSE